MSEHKATPLGPTFGRALAYAAELHTGHYRKGDGKIPYISHLLAVSSLAIEHGASQDQAIAALLHDALEDQGHRTSYEELGRLFGPEVARIVRSCSDTEVIPKPPSRVRKKAYVEHLEHADQDVLLVSCADKLHNARSILSDHRAVGNAIFERFSDPDPELTLWYYGSMSEVFSRRLPGRLSDELARVVAELTTAVEAATAASPPD